MKRHGSGERRLRGAGCARRKRRSRRSRRDLVHEGTSLRGDGAAGGKSFRTDIQFKCTQGAWDGAFFGAVAGDEGCAGACARHKGRYGAKPAEVKAEANSGPAATDAERQAVIFTSYDLDVRLTPQTEGLAVRALLKVRNSGEQPLAHVPLQLTSTLTWQSVAWWAVRRRRLGGRRCRAMRTTWARCTRRWWCCRNRWLRGKRLGSTWCTAGACR